MVAGHESRNPIVCNDYQKSNQRSNTNNRVFRCGQLYRTTRTFRAMIASTDNPHRCTTLVNDRKNNRENGIHGPKQIKTMDQRECTCFFRFMVKWEIQVGFYIHLEKSAGESYHYFHPKVLDSSAIPFPTRLLTLEQVENTLNVVNASANKGTGRNYLRSLMVKYISLIKISYMSQKACGKNHSTTNDIEIMINNFKESNEIAFISFSDVPVQDFLEDVTGVIADEASQFKVADKLLLLFPHANLAPRT